MQVVRATDSRAARGGIEHLGASGPAALPRIGAVREFGRIVTRSPVMHEMIDVLDRFAKTDITVTLLGETGVGKDILAHAMHERSTRAHGPFVVFDCAAVAANLAESELLGHERGAFTGALSAHAGAFERAHAGTLFLDEIAELPLDLQPRLLRGLESRRVRRVGGRVDRRVDVRVIAATNRDLKSEVIAGRFRGDLYFRLAVAVVQVPSLRRRLEDLPQLVQDLLSDLGHPNMRVSEAAFALLRAHGWTGNIRELKNALSCAAAFVEPRADIIEPNHLKLIRAAERDRSWLDGLPLAGHALDLIERAAIRQTLEQTRGNRKHAAQVLGIAVSTLYEKVKKYGL
ncbi:MAG TPA: sigma-54 dependent transcriptional regulator [Bryobacteraceae bacterium]|nr:sigma-54 dependent transcriptional regulator [Bryobacteraceae bacterium]